MLPGVSGIELCRRIRLLKPIRSLSLSPHVRRELSAEVRVKMTVAAS